MEMTPDTFSGVEAIKTPFLLGFIYTSILFGCCLISFTRYLQFSYGTDGRGTRILVIATALVALATMSFAVTNTMREFTFEFGKFPTAESAKWSTGIYILEITAHVLVTGSFGVRAWVLHGRPLYIAIPLVVVMLCTTAGAIGATVVAMSTAADAQGSNLGHVFNSLWLAGQVATNVTVTTLLFAKLKTSKSDDEVMNRSFRSLAIQTQLSPTLVSIASLVVYLAASKGYRALFIGLALLYILCFYTALNHRYHLSARGVAEASSTWSQKDDVRSRRTIPATSINVTTETYTYAQAADPRDKKRSARVRGAGGTLADSTESLQDGHEDSKDLNTSEIRLV